MNAQLIEEISEFNRRLDLTAKIRMLRYATKSLDTDIFDKTDWIPGQEIRYAAAICVVDVYVEGELYFTAPNRLVVYTNDYEYLCDAVVEVLAVFSEGREKGVLT